MQTPIADDACREIVRRAVPSFEAPHPPAREPPPPQLVVTLDAGERFHRRDTTEVDEHASEIEQHHVDFAGLHVPERSNDGERRSSVRRADRDETEVDAVGRAPDTTLRAR